jgi:hypothetical protein
VGALAAGGQLAAQWRERGSWDLCDPQVHPAVSDLPSLGGHCRRRRGSRVCLACPLPSTTATPHQRRSFGILTTSARHRRSCPLRPRSRGQPRRRLGSSAGLWAADKSSPCPHVRTLCCWVQAQLLRDAWARPLAQALLAHVLAHPTSADLAAVVEESLRPCRLTEALVRPAAGAVPTAGLRRGSQCRRRPRLLSRNNDNRNPTTSRSRPGTHFTCCRPLREETIGPGAVPRMACSRA